MKRFLSILLAAVVMMTLLSACGADSSKNDEESASVAEQAVKEYPDVHTLYYRDHSKSDKADVTFFNSDTGESAVVGMEKIAEDDESVTFSCEGDCSLYNMAYVTCGDTRINVFQKFAFNPCTSGWQKTKDDLLPYTYGEEPDYFPECDEAVFDCKGYEKTVRIWKPDGYGDDPDEKYSAVYVLDGQAMIPAEKTDQARRGSPIVTEQVNAMAALTGQKAIVVAINSDVARDYEMTPEIGESFDEKMFKEHNDGEEIADQYDSMNGSEFGEFVAKTLVPYIRKNYSVYTDALHTAVSGYSMGGLEAFYLTVEYPEIFGTVGALSPSLWQFDDDVWNAYLSEKDFTSDAPLLYLYAGNLDRDIGAFVKEMAERLKKLGYPEDRITVHLYEEGVHDARCWRNVFSEFLTAMVYRQVKPLQR